MPSTHDLRLARYCLMNRAIFTRVHLIKTSFTTASWTFNCSLMTSSRKQDFPIQVNILHSMLNHSFLKITVTVPLMFSVLSTLNLHLSPSFETNDIMLPICKSSIFTFSPTAMILEQVGKDILILLSSHDTLSECFCADVALNKCLISVACDGIF